jgi:hypothetical protein
VATTGDIETGQPQCEPSRPAPTEAQQQGDGGAATTRTLPGMLQRLHAIALRRALLAIQRSSANSSTMPAEATPWAHAPAMLLRAVQPGAAPGPVHRPRVARRRLQGQQQGTRQLWIAQRGVAGGIPITR